MGQKQPTKTLITSGPKNGVRSTRSAAITVPFAQFYPELVGQLGALKRVQLDQALRDALEITF